MVDLKVKEIDFVFFSFHFFFLSFISVILIFLAKASFEDCGCFSGYPAHLSSLSIKCLVYHICMIASVVVGTITALSILILLLSTRMEMLSLAQYVWG